jgi:hypothetical protein
LGADPATTVSPEGVAGPADDRLGGGHDDGSGHVRLGAASATGSRPQPDAGWVAGIGSLLPASAQGVQLSPDGWLELLRSGRFGSAAGAGPGGRVLEHELIDDTGPAPLPLPLHGASLAFHGDGSAFAPNWTDPYQPP